MSNFILNDIRFLYAGHDLSGDGNSIEITETATMEDDTVFTDTAKSNRVTVVGSKFAYAGFTQFGVGAVEETIAALKGLPTSFAVLVSKTGDAGNACHFLTVAQSTSKVLSGRATKLLGFTIDGENRKGHGVIDGFIVEPGKVARTGVFDSATQTMPAVSSTQRLFAAIQVLGFTGTSCTLKIQSAAAGDPTFVAPTDRFTRVASAAGTSFYEAPVAGAITDTLYRVDATGTFSSILVAVAIGIR